MNGAQQQPKHRKLSTPSSHNRGCCGADEAQLRVWEHHSPRVHSGDSTGESPQGTASLLSSFAHRAPDSARCGTGAVALSESLLCLSCCVWGVPCPSRSSTHRAVPTLCLLGRCKTIQGPSVCSASRGSPELCQGWVMWGHAGALGSFGVTSQPSVPAQHQGSVTLLWRAPMVPSTERLRKLSEPVSW